MIFILVLTDKLTKEEEEIYQLQHDLERTAITQQRNQNVSEVSSFCVLQLGRASSPNVHIINRAVTLAQDQAADNPMSHRVSIINFFTK